MNTNPRTILYAFTRQEHSNGCGAACLKMILKYAGLDANLPANIEMETLSMLRIQELAVSQGLAAKTVRMDIEHLLELESPCILHVLTDELAPHYIVYLGFDAVFSLLL